MLRIVLRILVVLSAIPVALIFNNIWQNHRNLHVLRKNEAEFHWSHIVEYEELQRVVNKLPHNYGVMFLNRHAVRMTLNWLCNTKSFVGAHQRMLFIVMDKHSENSLRKFYPKLNIVIWLAPALQNTFRPYDTTYMSFFLMRTNFIHALQKLGKGFWMLQADTVWRDNFFNVIDVRKYEKSDILLDQQGYEGTAPIRQRTMNGANFYVPVNSSSQQLVESWLSWQKSVYITDPDLVKIFCLRGDYLCDYIPYSLVTGWEWIYGDQKNPPVMIQMDGETGGDKEKVLEKYDFWFLDRLDRCKADKVAKGVEQLASGSVPRVNTVSKSREQFYLKLGELMNQIPVFGHYSSIYGGLTSLYLQIF
uniref:Nucleotid_trans domain-containing protein n=1 Tax=Caenorhabditis japonica TaxID=281687 RepID=A0A8R1E165_CAEJA